jgi:hypothetical protein
MAAANEWKVMVKPKLYNLIRCLVLLFSPSMGWAQTSGETDSFEYLTSSYSQFLQELESPHDLQAEEIEYWRVLFEDSLDEWVTPRYRRVAWDVIISLNNAAESWEASLQACNSAIDESQNDESRFDFEYDRWTVLQRLDGSRHRTDAEGPVPDAGDAAVATYMRMFEDDPDADSVKIRAAKFAALAQAGIRNPAHTGRLELAKDLVRVGRKLDFAKHLGENVYLNHVGLLAGLQLKHDRYAEAAKSIALLTDENEKLLACVVAMETAESEDVPDLAVNQFLWKAMPQFKSETSKTNLAVRHVMAAMKTASSESDRRLQTSDAATTLAGIPSPDLLNLLEPPVSAMLASGQFDAVPGTGATQSYREDFALLHTSINTLARLLELMGDHDTAMSYWQQTNPFLSRVIEPRNP